MKLSLKLKFKLSQLRMIYLKVTHSEAKQYLLKNLKQIQSLRNKQIFLEH